MSSTNLIAIIVALIVTTGGVLVVYDISTSYREAGRRISSQQETERGTPAQGGLEIVNVVGANVSDEGVKYVQVQVRYTGDGELNLNDTFIQLRTDKSITDLRYRNGTTNRSLVDGFYTQ